MKPFIRTIIVAIATLLLGFSQATFPESCKLTRAIQLNFNSTLDGWKMVVFFALPSLLVLIFDLIERRRIRKEHPEAPEIVLASINEAVGAKKDRFMDHKCIQEQDTFLEITQPENQLKELVLQLHTALDKVIGNEIEAVALAQFESNKVQKIYHAPKSKRPTLTPSDLGSGNTFFHYVQKTGKPQHIKSFRELKREGEKGGKKIQQKFLFKTEEDIDGSIIGYPIRSGDGNVALVLTIYSKKAGIHKPMESVSRFIKMYMDRMVLEICLYKIKNDHSKLKEVSHGQPG